MTSSVYKSVNFDELTSKLVARIYVHARSEHLSCFVNEDGAAIAYNNTAPRHYGESATCNDIED